MEALKSAMIVGALPCTKMMELMWVSLAKALYREGQRDRAVVTAE